MKKIERPYVNDRVEFFNDSGELMKGKMVGIMIFNQIADIELNSGSIVSVPLCEVFKDGSFKGYDPNDIHGSWNLTAIEWLMCTMHNLNFGEVYRWWNDLPSFVTDCLSRRYTNNLQFGQEEVMFHFYMGREGKLGAEILDIIEAEWGLSRKEKKQ